MKLKVILAVSVLALMSAACVFADDINVTVDGEPVVFDGAKPVIIDGSTLVPLRGVFENLGFNVEWVSETKTAVLTRGNTQISASVNKLVVEEYGSTPVTINGVQPQIINDYFMVPVRAISEASGSTVDWDQETRTVSILSEYTPEINSAVEPKGLLTVGADEYIETAYGKVKEIRELIKNSNDEVLMRYLNLGYIHDNSISASVSDYTQLKTLVDELYAVEPPSGLRSCHEYVKEYCDMLCSAMNISKAGFAGTIAQEEMLAQIDELKDKKDELAMEFSVELYDYLTGNSVFFEGAYDEYLLDMLK